MNKLAAALVGVLMMLSACAGTAESRFYAAKSALIPVFEGTVALHQIGVIDNEELKELKRLAVIVNEKLMQWSLNPSDSELEKGYLAALSVYNTFKDAVR